jgi:hypothetical protein
MRDVKIFANELFFGVVGFLISVVSMTLWRRITSEPDIYFLSLFFHIVEIITLMYFVKKIMYYVPGVFDVPFSRDNTLVSAVVLLLVDWGKLDKALKRL